MKIFNLIMQLIAIIGATIIMFGGEYIISLLIVIYVAIWRMNDNMNEINERLERLEDMRLISMISNKEIDQMNKPFEEQMKIARQIIDSGYEVPENI